MMAALGLESYTIASVIFLVATAFVGGPAGVRWVAVNS
jgi:hypothetical protein